jgi:hypothetical protein
MRAKEKQMRKCRRNGKQIELKSRNKPIGALSEGSSCANTRAGPVKQHHHQRTEAFIKDNNKRRPRTTPLARVQSQTTSCSSAPE